MTRSFSTPLKYLLESEWAGNLTVVDFSDSGDLESACGACGVGYISWHSWEEYREAMPSTDLIVSYKLPQIIPGDIVARSRYGGVNIHPSLLPAYPGLNPWPAIYFDMVLNTGVTIHHLSDTADSGNILLRESFNIEPGETLPAAIAESETVATGLLRKLLIDKVYLSTGLPQGQRERPEPLPFEAVRELPVYRLWHFLRGFPMLIHELFPDLPSSDFEVREYIESPTEFSLSCIISDDSHRPLIACRDGYIPLYSQS